MQQEKNCQVLATPKSGYPKPYFVHYGLLMTKEYAEQLARDCNEMWGETITYSVIENHIK